MLDFSPFCFYIGRQFLELLFHLTYLFMNNFVTKVWFQALKRPQCLLYAMEDSTSVTLFIAAALFFITGFAGSASFLFILAVLYVLFAAVTPQKTIQITVTNGTLHILIFNSDFKRHHKKIAKHKRAVIRGVLEDGGGKFRVLFHEKEIFGYDDRLVNSGVFLFKPSGSEWAAFCLGHENGHMLGRRIKDFIFVDRDKDGKIRLEIISNGQINGFEADFLEAYPLIFFDKEQASVQALMPSGSALGAGFILEQFGRNCILFGDKDRFRLLQCVYRDRGEAKAFFITTPSLFWDKNGKRREFKADKDGYFVPVAA